MNNALDELDKAFSQLKLAALAALPELAMSMGLITFGILIAIVALLIDGSLTWTELFGGAV